jgi:hypothetical protein
LNLFTKKMCARSNTAGGSTAMPEALGYTKYRPSVTRTTPFCLQLRVLDNCSDPGGLQLRGELLARQWCEAAGAAAVALLPNVDPQALTKKLVQVTTASTTQLRKQAMLHAPPLYDSNRIMTNHLPGVRHGRAAARLIQPQHPYQAVLCALPLCGSTCIATCFNPLCRVRQRSLHSLPPPPRPLDPGSSTAISWPA